MLALFFILACSGEQAVNISTDCPNITDESQRNSCYHQQILTLPVTDIAEIIKTAQQISDPMIRGAAVSEWVKDHNNGVSQQQGQKLCALLDGRDRSYCLRRLSSPHLRRDK